MSSGVSSIDECVAFATAIRSGDSAGDRGAGYEGYAGSGE